MLEASDAAFLLLLSLAMWKAVEVVLSLRRPQPVRKRSRMELQAAEIAMRHLRTLEFLHTKEGTKLHMRGCHFLKDMDEAKATSRSRGSEGKPNEATSRMLCSYCAARLEESLRIELEVTD